MIRVIPLGGLGEIGRNIMVIEDDHYILVVDAGIMFPDDYMPGVDLVIPDFRYLRENRDKVKAVILTHGHEDHIGAMPFFLKDICVPVFGTSFTLELLKEKLKEHHLPKTPDFFKVKPGDTTQFGPFKVEYIGVNHSIVDGVGLAIETDEGTIIHSGDFRIDPTPVGSQPTDLGRFAHFGEKGVLALFSDSTNAEKEGFTLSEREVTKTLEELFRTCQGRLILASFASNMVRIQQAINLAVKFERKVVFNGKSMFTNVGIAKREGFISIPEGVEIGERQISQFPDRCITVITTGSQGEPMSALTRMARGKHKNITIKQNDTVILSSRFIPGNEKAITATINNLYRMGAEVVYEKVSEIHTSGHARREELKLMLSLVKPRFFIPIHGEYRHLVKHAQLALDMGMEKDRVIVAEDGDVISFENQKMRSEDHVHAGQVFVDGKGVGDVEEMVLKDRRRLSEHGIVIVLLGMDRNTSERVYGPEIISRGFVLEDETGSILEDAKHIVLEVLEQTATSSSIEWASVETDIGRRLKKFFQNVIERRPLIIPTIMQV